MIKEFITDICELLNIKEPYVSYDVADFATDTTMAQCDVANNTIYLYKLDKPNPDYLFSIAHELLNHNCKMPVMVCLCHLTH